MSNQSNRAHSHNHGEGCNHDHEDDGDDDIALGSGGPSEEQIQALMAMLGFGKPPGLTPQESTLNEILKATALTPAEREPINGMTLEELREVPSVIVGGGVDSIYAFSRDRLFEAREQIVSFIKENVADVYLAEGGAQVTTLLLDRDGAFWTHDVLFAESLLAISEALGLARFPLPREDWTELPHVQFSSTGFQPSA